MFSFFTSETARGKSRDGCTGLFSSESVLQAGCPSPRGEGRRLRKTSKNSSKGPCLPTAARHRGKRQPSSLPRFADLQSGITEHCSEREASTALHGGRHREGSNHRYCFIMISKDHARQNGKHTEPEWGRGRLWQPRQGLYIKTFVNQESLLRGLFGMKSGDCLCLVWFKSNQQIHLLENGVIKLFVCVETWCGSLDT